MTLHEHNGGEKVGGAIGVAVEGECCYGSHRGC